MRHMRSRRILAMLLALSMIFGLLTTTAFAGEVDQNTSNVGESAANGTSEGGSGEGQSSGASEDESSKVTNKEDVPTEEETTPEEKKTTSSEEVDTQEGEGEQTVVGGANSVASIGETGYESLDAAIQAAQDNDTIVVSAGEYTLNGNLTYSGKAFTIKAADNETVSFDMSAAVALHGAKITFEGVTFDYKTNGNYIGLQHADTLVYNNCIINGKVFLYAGKETFNHCTFNQDSADYCVWTYGAAETTFNNCTFNCKGKAVLVYNEGYIKTVNVEVNNTTFAASETVDKKAAIELDTHLMKGASINVDNASTATGFSTNTTDGAGLWNAKRIDSENNETVEVVVGGEVKYTLSSAPVAMVNGVSYNKLEDAFAALSDEAYTLTLNDESAWDTATPVYWAAGEQSGYAATLAEALTKAYMQSAESIKIICRPDADVGTMTHGHAADNLTIYGNKAYISAGECDLEVDTFKFDRSTGRQATDGVTLDKDITITAYELDNLGVWGQRNTNHIVTINLTECDGKELEKNVQRVYLSGAKGTNNITLTDCKFITEKCPIYSNADGSVTVKGCTFTGVAEPINLKHKGTGTATYTVEGCTFTDCGSEAAADKAYAAPIRFVSDTAEGTVTATVSNCSFSGTIGQNGDILLGDGRPGEPEYDVALTVENTTAKVMAQKGGYYDADGNVTDTNKGATKEVSGETLTTSISALISGGESGNAIVDEKTLRKALFDAPTDGTQITIKLENDITLDMLYAAENFDEEKLDDNATGDTFNRYKLGVHPTEDDPDHWNPLVTNQSQEARLLYGAYYHMSATDERIARLVVKAGQNIVLDLNGHTIQKNPRATHGDWSNTCTDILANYGTLTITDTSTGAEGTIKGNGYISCQGAVLHNYAGATMNVGAINVDGNAAGMSKGTGQYVVVNEGGMLSIDGANIFDTATSASLLVNTAGTMSVKHATLSHPATKTFNVKGGTVEINEGVEITSDTYAIYVASGTVKLNANVLIQASTAGAAAGTLAIEGETAKVEKAESVEMAAPAGYKWENNVLVKASTGIKGSSAENAYTLEELGKMTRNDYIAAQKELGGTMYVSVGNYSYDTDGVLGNGVRDDTPGQTPDHSKLNAYGENGYLGEKNDGANGLNIVFVNGSITSGVKGYTSIDNIGTSLLLAVPAYTNVTFKGITFNNVMCFNYQLYTSPWSQLGELKFDGCTFNGIIVGATAAQTLTFNGCTFTNFTNTTDANSSNPTWIRPAYGNWTPSDNKGQGSDFRSLTTINFTNNTVTSTRPVKFEYISQWNNTTTLTATGNSFDISAQKGDTKVKNVGMYFGSHTDENAFNLVLDRNEKIGNTAALYTLNENQISLPVGSTVKDPSGNAIEITDALEWKTENPITLKTEPVPAVKNVAKVGDTEYATLEAAVENANAGDTVTLLADINDFGGVSITKNLTVDFGAHTITGAAGAVVFNVENATVTLNGTTGGIDGGEGGNNVAVRANTGSDITINGGVYTVGGDADGLGNSTIHAMSTGKVTINGGTFSSKAAYQNKYYVLNIQNGNAATITVNGGSFENFDPFQGDDHDGGNFCADGVGVDNVDGTFTAVKDMTAQILDADGSSVKAYDSLAEAIAAAEAGQTVRLLANATEDVTINKNITLDLGGKTLTNTGAGKATVYVPKDVKATVKNGIVMGGASYYNIAVGTEAAPGGELTLIGVTATAGNDGSSMIDNWGTLTIESGTYTGGLNVVKSEPNAVLTITGGKFTLNSAVAWSYTGVILTYGTAKIEGGEFVQNAKTPAKASPCVVITAKEKVDDPNPSTEITGGTFTNNHTSINAKIFHGMNKATSDNFEVKGGTFNKSISEGYCADGFIPTKKADGTYGVKEGKYVASIGSKNYETLADAIRLAAKNKTVTLLDDVAENVTIAENKVLTLDLNGHTINGGTGTAKATITNNGTVTITDSSTAKTGTIKRDDNGTVGETSYYVIHNIGTMTIEQAIVTNNSGYRQTNPSGSMNGSSLICNGDDLGGTLNISGGKFEQRNFIAIKNGALGKLNVTGGTISSDHSAIQNWFDATITGGEINGQLWTDAYKEGESVGHTTIGGSAKYTGEIVMDIYGSVKPTLEISGGTLDVTNWRITNAASKAGAKPAVSGGKFTSAVPKNYCADGYVPTKNEDGTYGVKVDDSVAEVGGVKYLSLQAAIDAAGRKQTVKLLKDTRENVTIATPYLTLDLNGHTLNGGQEKGKPALTVTARVTVMDSSADMSGTIMREDTAKNSGVSSHYVIDVQGAGWLTFESGNVINHSGTEEGKGASLVRVGDDSVEKYPGLNIKGGSFKQDNFIAIKVDRGDLFLNGGTIASKNSYAIENWHRATIKGGTVNGTVSTWVYKDGNSVNDLEISGGTINGNVASVTYDKAEGKTAKVTISGGTVTGTLGTYSYNNGLVPLENPAMATIGVTGGTFVKDPKKYVVEGSTVKNNADGTFGVEKAYLATVGDKSYYTMEEAFKAQTASGDAIVLLRDYTTGSSFNSGTINRTVDLNGHTWTYTGTDTNCAAFEVNNPNVTLTVKSGKVVSNSMIGLIPSAMGGTITYDNSGLVFESVEATANGNSGIETNGNNTNDTVTLKNSTLNVPNGFGIYFPSSGKLTIDNSKITAKTLGVQVCSGSLDISGAETKIEVTGDPVPKTENDGAIQDGAAISIVNRTGYKGLGTITVTEGIFTAKSGNAAVKAYNWANQAESDFTASDKVAISGGTFSSAVAPEYCAEGFEPKDNGDGTYGVQPDGNVAEIGSVKYASLDEALKAAKDRETVKLLKDAELEEVVIRSGRTLDLNGHTLKADYVTYFGGNLVDNSAAHTGLLKVLSADEILFTKNKKIDAMTQIPIYSLEKQGYVFEEIVLRVAPVTNKTPGALQAVYRPRQKDGASDLSDAQKAMFGSANGHPVTATFRLVYKYKNSNEVQTFEFDFVDTYMDIYLNQNLYMYVTVTGLDIENIETITVTPVLKSAGGQVELVGKTIDTAAVLANLIGQ